MKQLNNSIETIEKRDGETLQVPSGGRRFVNTIAISIKIFVFFTVLTGILYPLSVTVIAQVVFPRQANGSLIYKNNRLVGSSLIGQQSDSVAYFSSRPSAVGYNALPSGGSNYGPTSSTLRTLVASRQQQFIARNGLNSTGTVPSEMLFASASGLDPHISPEAAALQINRIVAARGFTALQKEKLKKLLEETTEHPQFYCLGQSRVNVLQLNLKLDDIR